MTVEGRINKMLSKHQDWEVISTTRDGWAGKTTFVLKKN
jgi:hypothetical protein